MQARAGSVVKSPEFFAARKIIVQRGRGRGCGCDRPSCSAAAAAAFVRDVVVVSSCSSDFVDSISRNKVVDSLLGQPQR